MDEQKIYNLIDEYVNGIQGIDQNFEGSGRVEVQEKEQGHYKTKFAVLGINPDITSDIYDSKHSPKDIDKIKKDITKYLITN